MSAGDFAVHVVNPKRHKGGHSAKRGHRRNPTGGGGGGGSNLLRMDWMRVVWMIAGDLWISYFTRNWGDKWGTSMLDGKQLTSPYAGQAWTMKNYLMAAATGFGIAKLLQRMKRGTAAQDFMLGIKVGLVRRIVWTEGFARVGWGQKYFGDIQDVYSQGGGQFMQVPGGGWQQVMDGPSVGPQPWMMAGPQVNNRQWMMLGPGEEMTEYGESPMGHAITGQNFSPELASYQYSGDADPYSASYQT